MERTAGDGTLPRTPRSGGERQWSDRTAFDHGMLSVDQEALRRLVMEEGDFASVDLEIVRPGEAVRLIHVIDVVEPRCKAAGGSTFPGRLETQDYRLQTPD